MAAVPQFTVNPDPSSEGQIASSKSVDPRYWKPSHVPTLLGRGKVRSDCWTQYLFIAVVGGACDLHQLRLSSHAGGQVVKYRTVSK